VLREYSLLADGERGVVVGPRGDFAWMCMPGWADDAVFSSLMGGPGVYAVTPRAASFVWGGHYEPGSLIWRSRWVTTTGIVECREALALPADQRRAVVMRQVVAVRGGMDVDVELAVRPGFGRDRMEDLDNTDGVWTARSGAMHLRWTGVGHATRQGDGLVAGLQLREGERHDLVLEIGADRLPSDPVTAEYAWASTEEAWQREVPGLDDTIAPRDSRHAYAVLRGMTSRRTGAMVAAATTALPERAAQGRNYDYRYAWVRDQCYAGSAVAVNGALPLLDDAVEFVSGRLLEDGADLQPAYTQNGEPVRAETSVGLPGYPGGSDKVGNQARDQFQLDNFGEALLLLAAGARLDRLESRHWRAAETAVAAVRRRRLEPDSGIWELDDDHWAHSRLICAAGLRAAARHAPAAQAADWLQLADTIVADTDRPCLHPTGRWQRSPVDDRVDASLLLPAVRGAVPAHDPRSMATWRAVRHELAQEHYLYRFRHDDRPLEAAEGAFLVCGFHMALATHQQGDEADAMRWFERNRAACGPPGLLTEEFDVVQRQLRGNLPQAFVHALLLESARRLAEPPPTGEHGGT
jgi:alpha,alpha-trehalase